MLFMSYFPISMLGQVWYLIVSIPDLCTLTYFVYVMFSRLFIAASWSPAGKGLTSCHSFVMSNCVLVTFPLVSWVRCGA